MALKIELRAPRASRKKEAEDKEKTRRHPGPPERQAKPESQSRRTKKCEKVEAPGRATDPETGFWKTNSEIPVSGF